MHIVKATGDCSISKRARARQSLWLFAPFCGQITVVMRQYENWLCRDVSGKSLAVTKFPRVSVVHNTVLHVVVVQT